VAVAAFLLTEIDSTWASVAKKAVARLALTRASTAAAWTKIDDGDVDQAYAAGVLSVAGLLPLVDASGITDHVPEWIEVSAEAIEKQRELFGTDFLEIDRWISVIWRLPLEMPYSNAKFAPSQPFGNENAYPIVLQSGDQGTRNLVLVSRGRL
jgi:HD-like signal output (HDOD) protein